MKNSIKIFLTIAIVAITMVSCKKDPELTDPKTQTEQTTNPDADKTEDDKPDAIQDSIRQTKALIEPLKEEDKVEKTGPTKNSLVAYQGRVKVILKLKSIQCISVSDGRVNSNGTEELYGTINSSLCESIAPNNTCQTSANYRMNESRTYQRTLARYLSGSLFDVDRPSYLSFARFSTLNPNSYHVYDYSYANAHYPNIKLQENIKENDFNGWNDADDSYYFIGGTPIIYLAGLSFNDIHEKQFQLGDGSSRYLVTTTVQKIYY